jgi:hypothetical protein
MPLSLCQTDTDHPHCGPTVRHDTPTGEPVLPHGFLRRILQSGLDREGAVSCSRMMRRAVRKLVFGGNTVLNQAAKYNLLNCQEYSYPDPDGRGHARIRRFLGKARLHLESEASLGAPTQWKDICGKDYHQFSKGKASAKRSRSVSSLNLHDDYRGPQIGQGGYSSNQVEKRTALAA